MSKGYIISYLVIILCVALRVLFLTPTKELPDNYRITEPIRVLTSPQLVGNTEQFSTRIEEQRVKVILPRFSDVGYGDLLLLDGTLKKKVLDNKNVVYSISFPKVKRVEADIAWHFRLAGKVRERVMRAFSFYLNEEQAGLLLGIVFGISTGLSQELKSNFQVSGVTHVIAASGMNVTLLAGFVLPLLERIMRRQHALLLTILLLLFYAVLSGLSASIVRATIMAVIGFIGLLIGRQRTSFISFFLTGCIMILITPSMLWDIGFQLSFAATAGMLVVRPLLVPYFSHRVFSFVREDLSATLASQITTLPLILYYFHTVGLLAIVVNMLVLWTIPPLMIIGSLSGLVSLVSVWLGGIMALVSMPLLAYFLALTSFFPLFTPQLKVTEVPVLLVVGYYLLCGASYLLLLRRKATHHEKVPHL